MPGKCPDHLRDNFLDDIQDGLTVPELAEKYNRAERTISSWKKKLFDSGYVRQRSRGRQKSGIEVDESDDTLIVSSITTRIKSLEQLLEEARVDLSVWEVESWRVKKWDMGAKVKEGELVWTDGRIDGWMDYKGIGVEQLWSVQAVLIRKAPLKVFADFAVIKFDPVIVKKREPQKIRRFALGSDMHFGFKLERGKLVPFHDRVAMDLFCQIVNALKPDEIKLLGDLVDLPDWSLHFVRSPDMEYLTQITVCETAWWLSRLRTENPNVPITVFEGNHDARLTKLMVDRFKSAYKLRAATRMDGAELFSLPSLLGLDDLGIDWIGDYPDGDEWAGNCRIYHGSTSNAVSGKTSSASVGRNMYSEVRGHSHRDEHASKTAHTSNNGVKIIRSHLLGCLCRIDGVVPGKFAKQNWQQGMGVIDFSDAGFNVNSIPIEEGRAIWDKTEFVGEDPWADIRDYLGRYEELKIYLH